MAARRCVRWLAMTMVPKKIKEPGERMMGRDSLHLLSIGCPGAAQSTTLSSARQGRTGLGSCANGLRRLQRMEP